MDVKETSAIKGGNFLTKITFTVDTIIYSDNVSCYKIIKPRRIKVLDGGKNYKSDCIIKGFLPTVKSGDSFDADCNWVKNGKYGWQLDIVKAERSVIKNKRSLKSFLKKT